MILGIASCLEESLKYQREDAFSPQFDLTSTPETIHEMHKAQNPNPKL